MRIWTSVANIRPIQSAAKRSNQREERLTNGSFDRRLRRRGGYRDVSAPPGWLA